MTWSSPPRTVTAGTDARTGSCAGRLAGRDAMPVSSAASMRLLGSRSVSGVVALDDIAALIDQLRPAPARGEPVLVVVPADDGPTARRTLSMARAAAPGAHAVVHETHLPPVARRHLVDTLASLSPRLTAGELLIACELVERDVVAGALLHSVTKLGTPAPTMGQHMRSWLPSSRFVVQTHPEPRVALLDLQSPGTLGLPETRVGWRMVCTPVDPSDEIAVLLLAQQLTGTAAEEVSPPDGSGDRWKSAFCEFAAFPADITTLVQRAVADARPCRACGAALVWPQCRVCGAQQGDDSATPTAGITTITSAADTSTSPATTSAPGAA